MELFNKEEFETYIRRSFECIVTNKTYDLSTQISDKCDFCQRDAFLKIYSRNYLDPVYESNRYIPRFVSFFIECPNCLRKCFLHTVQLANHKLVGKDEDDEDIFEDCYEHYKLYRLPVSDENFINQDIPGEYVSLKDTTADAAFCLTHSKYIAAAILFRRAIQILAKDILGGVGRNLFEQLQWLKTNKNNLNVDLSEVFHDNAKIIKDIGNQGAHPDEDITLHNFSKEDAEGLHDLFITIIHEVFVKPAKLKTLQEDLMKSRKLK